jgi:trimeric autotransporter adhesin
MKPIVIFLFLCIVTMKASYSQNVNIPDEKFKNALLSNTEINLNGDGEIQVAEALAYTGEISVNTLSINDMTGIEAFEKITSLNCSYNSIPSLDLSNNLALIDLSCTYNSLEELILGDNPVLELIFCYNNNLTELNLEKLVSLETLRCGNNPITRLDISGNHKLKTLDCRSSLLTSLNVRNGNNSAIDFFYIPDNPWLSCVDVDDVAYATEHWTNIDPWVEFSTDCFPWKITFTVTGDTEPIAGAVIRMRIFFDDIIVTTDVSGQASIGNMGKGQYVYIVEAAGYQGIVGKLEISDADAGLDIQLVTGTTDTVDIPDANFKQLLLSDTTININKDDKIQITEAQYYQGAINVANSDIDNLKGIEAFINMKELDCHYNNISSLDLSNNSALEVIDCRNNQLQTLIMGTNTNLLHIYCYYNQLNSLDVSGLSSLKTLNCGNNQIEHLDLSNNSDLTFFDCRNSSLSNLDIRNGNNTAITHFYIPNNINLFCINVDDVAYSTANWTDVDQGVVFSTDCSESFDLTFSVTDGTNPVENARIKFNGIYHNTGPDGTVEINAVSIGQYYYSVYAESCQSVMSSLHVTGNKTESVVLSAGSPDIVYIPDYHLMSFLLNNSSVNIDGDAEIQVSEAQAYTGEINVEGLGIKDMTGIEAFANISSLRCGNNNIQILDISNNLALTGLYCTYSSLEALIFGDNQMLETIFCYNNNLTELNLEELISLESLRCGNNPLTMLDVSNNSKLTTLDCRSSLLTNLDVRNGNNTIIGTFYMLDNPHLNCVNVDDVAFAHANWNDIDEGVIFATNCGGSDIASLESILVNGMEIPDFQPNLYQYSYELASGTTAIPVVTADPTDENAFVIITQADSLNGTAIVEIVSESGQVTEIYIIRFNVVTGIDNKLFPDVNVYPNPVNDYVIIDYVHIPDEVIIYNAAGERIIRCHPESQRINTNSLKPGIYFLGVIFKDDAGYIKFLKE